MLLVGPLALALIFGVAPRSDRMVAANAPDGLDTMTTGSVSSSHLAFALGRPATPGVPAGPCLRFPDGSQRGTC